MIVTRFAPSPTGRLHLGHAYSAIMGHRYARDAGGSFLLRIEDLDQTRSRVEFVEGIYADLDWLGLAWSEPVLVQSQRAPVYADALERLRALGLVYPCYCTRGDIAAALQEHRLDRGLPWPQRQRVEGQRRVIGVEHQCRAAIGMADQLRMIHAGATSLSFGRTELQLPGLVARALEKRA